jgi:hypothetical protein
MTDQPQPTPQPVPQPPPETPPEQPSPVEMVAPHPAEPWAEDEKLAFSQGSYSCHAFRMRWQGKLMPYNGDLSYDPGQCVDVANMWAKYIGIHESYGNANTLNYSRDCDWVPNTPTAVPKPGDIVIWNGYPADSQYGHVALNIFGSNVHQLRCLSQNWPEGSPVHVVLFGYQGVHGWWSPRKLQPHGCKT